MIKKKIALTGIAEIRSRPTQADIEVYFSPQENDIDIVKKVISFVVSIPKEELIDTAEYYNIVKKELIDNGIIVSNLYLPVFNRNILNTRDNYLVAN